MELVSHTKPVLSVTRHDPRALGYMYVLADAISFLLRSAALRGELSAAWQVVFESCNRRNIPIIF